MNELRTTNDLLDPQKGFLTFEEMRHENGNTYWLASELMKQLGYGDDMKSFGKAIRRASKAMDALGVDMFANISKIDTPDGSDDYKLTRFAAYLVVMNANPKFPEVAKAQAYFVMLTRQFEMWLENPKDVERVAIREEIKGENTRLSSTAKAAGVEDYAKFQNAGYLGMYNMMNVQLARRRGIDKNNLIDHMGSTEMAANLFRIEMTKARLEKDNIIGQTKAEAVHQDVGHKVRLMVKESTGKNPEDLPVERRLPDIHKQLKIGHKEMKKIDGGVPPKKASRKKSPPSES